MSKELRPVTVAVIDMYNGIENQGMRCIRDLLRNSDGAFGGVPVVFQEFDARRKADIPDTSFDIYISTGGPGSPFDGEGSRWEADFFHWMDALWDHNQQKPDKKHFMAICHSFQLMSRHFEIARVVKRKSDSFGIMPVHHTPHGRRDRLFSRLSDPYFAADFREWQVLRPDKSKLNALGASILALEKIRPHVPLERAVMAMRISDEIIGTQFHPEADPQGMFYHFAKDEQREKIMEKHGNEKFRQIMQRIIDPGALTPTYNTVIPGFLEDAIRVLRPEAFEG